MQWSAFRNPEVFEPDYIPEILAFRDAQLRALASNLKPMLSGMNAVDTVCIGPPATGKTSCVRKIISSAEIRAGYVNASLVRTRSELATGIFKAVTGLTPPRRGVSFSELMGRAFDSADSLLIVIDDATALNEKILNEVIVYVCRMKEMGYKAGLWLVFTDSRYVSLLSADTGSIFHPDEVFFHAYGYDEIFEILMERAKAGFSAGAFGEDVIDFATGMAFETADLRLGLYILRMAGIIADREGKERIGVDDAEKAYEKGKWLFLTRSLSNLSRDERRLLKAIYELDAETTGELFDEVRDWLYYEKFHRMLAKLENLRLIDLKLEYRKGRTRRIFRRFERDVLLDALERVSS
ncbi:AAA family ATPase [Archaeoglobus sulfaticallidus]|uniref:AAA family ATPase n=1 Tax=Archaeoglobus sulfaticallidus TaxID=1316941 RepID=UPI000AEB8C9F|nr:AAA family ATPase [Archaeoglobus sulfaticallidus]